MYTKIDDEIDNDKDKEANSKDEYSGKRDVMMKIKKMLTIEKRKIKMIKLKTKMKLNINQI